MRVRYWHTEQSGRRSLRWSDARSADLRWTAHHRTTGADRGSQCALLKRTIAWQTSKIQYHRQHRISNIHQAHIHHTTDTYSKRSCTRTLPSTYYQIRRLNRHLRLDPLLSSACRPKTHLSPRSTTSFSSCNGSLIVCSLHSRDILTVFDDDDSSLHLSCGRLRATSSYSCTRVWLDHYSCSPWAQITHAFCRARFCRTYCPSRCVRTCRP